MRQGKLLQSIGKCLASLAALGLCWLAPGAWADGDPEPQTEMAKAAERFAKAFKDLTPKQVAYDWLAPFALARRDRHQGVAVVSTFGAGRRSYKPGHIHTGADLIPRPNPSGLVKVLPMAPGAVCSVHLGEPHTTVVLVHLLPDGSKLYTSYKHLAQVFVETGQQVGSDTELGRLFTRAEAKKLGGNYDHLHLEVRKAFDDFGVASWLTMTRAQLDQRFMDPVAFMKNMLRRTRQAARKTPPARAKRLLASARELLGLPYQLGGRLRKPEDGTDCQGVVFYAAERIGRCGWKSFSVMPTLSVPRGELGKAVPGLDPVALAQLDTARLQPGDVVHLLAAMENPAEKAITTLKGRPVWVWHVGMVSEAGKWIHADPFGGQVVEEDLAGFMTEYDFEGLLITRMLDGPKPRRCKRHRPMKLHRPPGAANPEPKQDEKRP